MRNSTPIFGTANRKFATLLCVLAVAASVACAQGPTTPTRSDKPNARSVDHSMRSKRLHRASAVLPAAAQEPQPAPAPVRPNWPVEQSPARPAVRWDSHGLQIEATNASLRQILNEVSQETGAKVVGFSADQRVFGEYGPGQPREVLSQLLVGSGYNVLMIGGEGQGAPREILLSERRKGNNAAGATAQQPRDMDEDADSPEPEEPQPIPQPVNGIPVPGNQNGPPRNPQQMMQELQQRQIMMQREQQPPEIPQPPQ